ncbi:MULTISPECIES: hypothetical protein [Pasteurellaceae]|jgi:hypothetical protein|uniref:hypothetical protein n=1 Tax=Pasteurellaceae TaxID=712 RepID=UPI00147ED5C6|nr:MULTISPECIES: hypothetical protein [Pasteurellaceae]NNI00460.1 hypothetical protein [Pasteurella multocida]
MTTGILFDIGLLEAMDKNLVKQTLKINPLYQKYYQKLLDYIRHCIGHPLDFLAHPYRIAGERYLVIQVKGEKSLFNLTISIAGYLNWPDLKKTKQSYRLYMDVADSVDAYYLREYLRQDLFSLSTDGKLYTKNVDNPVNDEKNDNLIKE